MFRYLVYREFMLSKNKYLSSLPVALGVFAFSILIFFSAKYGNLAGMEESKELINLMVISLFYMGAVMFGSGPIAVSDGTQQDEIGLWSSYRRTTPVKPMTYALARYSVMGIYFVAGILLSVLLFSIFAPIVDMEVTINSLSLVLIMDMVFLIFSILMQIFTMLFRSVEKAGITLSLLMMLIVFLFVKIKRVPMFGGNSQSIEAEAFLKTLESMSGYLPIAIIVTVLFAAGGLFATARLMTRKES